jgi:hypothetical protein
MIIKSKPLSQFWLKIGGYILTKIFRIFFFNKLIIKPVEIKSDHSYILSINHFSFGDGFLGFYLAYQLLFKQGKMKRFYIMSLKKQMEKKWWLRYLGSFSVDPGKLSVNESLAYAAEILNEPGNLLLFFPQGNLESVHIRTIQCQDGIAQIVPQITGKCQLLWSSNIGEYFESIWPSVYFNMLDCGTAEDFNFDRFKQEINRHHKESLKETVRFTQEEDKSFD